jgi:hypothetical protein
VEIAAHVFRPLDRLDKMKASGLNKPFFFEC